MKAASGEIKSVRPILKNGRLRVVMKIACDSGEIQEAYLPDREISALLPRSILAGQEEKRDVPRQMLATIRPIITRMTRGRRVRVWAYGEDRYASFLSWRSVRFDSS